MTARNTAAFLRSQIRPGVILKALFWTGVFLLTAVGFDFKTPRQRFVAIDARADTTNMRLDSSAAHISAIDRRLDRIGDNFTIMFKLSCLDPKISRRDRQLVGLNCQQILNGPVISQSGEARQP